MAPSSAPRRGRASVAFGSETEVLPAGSATTHSTPFPADNQQAGRSVCGRWCDGDPQGRPSSVSLASKHAGADAGFAGDHAMRSTRHVRPTLATERLGSFTRYAGRTPERGTQESNLALRFWRPPCYRYTSPPAAPHSRTRRAALAFPSKPEISARRTQRSGHRGGQSSRPGVQYRVQVRARGDRDSASGRRQRRFAA
jgi:hypothetical protein